MDKNKMIIGFVVIALVSCFIWIGPIREDFTQLLAEAKTESECTELGETAEDATANSK
tara:strand:+ start:633 stop:806 length:174 start_codon:yes stop_codon:yes gene_type:complete